jgi:hypothetical protein
MHKQVLTETSHHFSGKKHGTIIHRLIHCWITLDQGLQIYNAWIQRSLLTHRIFSFGLYNIFLNIWIFHCLEKEDDFPLKEQIWTSS